MIDQQSGADAGRSRRITAWGFATAVAVIGSFLLFFLPTPYVVYHPGSAEVLDPIVTAGDDPPDEGGVLMLTTVRMTYANWAYYLYSYMTSYTDRERKEEVFDDESREEYNERQDFIMQHSQSDALRAAYEKLGIAYQVKTTDVMVLRTVPETPGAKVLQPGDILLKVDGEAVTGSEDLIERVSGKNIGDVIHITYRRGDDMREAEIRLTDLNALAESAEEEERSPRPGIGVYPVNLLAVVPDDPGDRVKIDAGEIGGPSAGLMFALEIYNTLSGENITKGYRIAGTGTITPDGEVGVIGGIEYKVVAAHKRKADIFFAPKDWMPTKEQKEQGYEPVLNATTAKNTAEDIGTDMKIVPVGNLSDALAYLEKLPAKSDDGK